MSEKLFRKRTTSYNKKGIYVLWIFGIKNFGDDRRVRLLERIVNFWYFGRCYYFGKQNGEGCITPTHWKTIIPNREIIGTEYFNNEWGIYTRPKYGKVLGWTYSNKIFADSANGSDLKNYSIICFENDGMKLARFTDKKFWV
jgi:hypothetical protein